MTLAPRIRLVSTTQPDKKNGMRGKDEQQLDVFSYIAPSSDFRKTPFAFAACHDR